MAQRSGGELLIDALLGHGVDLAFGIPGESFLAMLDAVHARAAFRFVVCRHEATASHAAEAYTKTTGRAGCCIVTRGPGASHAAVGVHTAAQDSSPLLLIVGLVQRDVRGRDAWQEVDVRHMFGAMAKRVEVVEEAARIPETVGRLLAAATSGRMGPVVLGVPEDVFVETADVADVPPSAPWRAVPSAAALAELRERLASAERPLVIAGGSGWNADACADLQRFAERTGLPVATAFRRQDLFDNRHPRYAGNVGLAIDPALAQRVRDADVVLALGTRLDEVTTSGYTLIESPVPRQRLLHIHPGAEELNRIYHAEVAIQADPISAATALAALAPLEGSRWSAWADDLHAIYRHRLERAPTPGPLDMVAVMRAIRDRLPDDAILTTGAGNYAAWQHRFYEHRRFGTQLAPISGSMGYGIPAALAASLAHPGRTVVAFAGDGCFQMSGHELATARQEGAAFVVIVMDNGIYGSIRMHQERHYPGRVVATDIAGPDFTAYARAYGAFGERVETTDAFAPAFERAIAFGGPAVLELPLTPEILTTDATLSTIRERALAAR